MILVSNPRFLGARNHFGPFPEALDWIEGQMTGRNIAKIRGEFDLDPLSVHKKQFHVSKVEIPEGGDENIELLDYLLYLRNNETEEELVIE